MEEATVSFFWKEPWSEAADVKQGSVRSLEILTMNPEQIQDLGVKPCYFLLTAIFHLKSNALQWFGALGEMESPPGITKWPCNTLTTTEPSKMQFSIIKWKWHFSAIHCSALLPVLPQLTGHGVILWGQLPCVHRMGPIESGNWEVCPSKCPSLLWSKYTTLYLFINLHLWPHEDVYMTDLPHPSPKPLTP